MRVVELLLAAEAAALAVGGVGLETAEAEEVAAEQHGGSYHQFEADRTLQFGFRDD